MLQVFSAGFAVATLPLVGCTPGREPAPGTPDPTTPAAPAEEVFHLDSGYFRLGYRVGPGSCSRVSLMAVIKGDEGYGYLTLDQAAVRMNQFGDVTGLVQPADGIFSFLRCRVGYTRVPSADPAGENRRLYALTGEFVSGKAHLVIPSAATAPFRLLLEGADGTANVVTLEATTQPVFQP